MNINVDPFDTLQNMNESINKNSYSNVKEEFSKKNVSVSFSEMMIGRVGIHTYIRKTSYL